MNLATKRVIEAVGRGDYARATEILNKYGTLIATGECSIAFYRLGDDFVCRRSVSQLDFAGYWSKAPYFMLPEHATRIEEERS